MKNSIIYEMDTLDDCHDLLSNVLLIIAIDDEERSKYSLNHLVQQEFRGKHSIVFTYNDKNINEYDVMPELKKILVTEEMNVIQLPLDQIDFVERLKCCESLITSTKIIIDISCLLTPYIFLLLKYINIVNKCVEITIINTVPYDYNFPKSPFISYKSYYGDLKMSEIYGFSGSNGINQENDLLIFAGFEGALANKVEEETSHKNLYIVNTLPSYYQKYKDISIINNYHLMKNKNFKMLYVPAINPFEVYNILDNSIVGEKSVSIAPLCTKPISLGICLYALKHCNVRIVYPFSDKYELSRSHGVHKSYYYKIKFN